jgi:hypothetical protein
MVAALRAGPAPRRRASHPAIAIPELLRKHIMNELLAPVRSRDQERQRILTTPPQLGARPSLADRLSLRIGLWLILRGERRLQRAADPLEHGRLLANERARLARERQAAAEQLLWSVRA